MMFPKISDMSNLNKTVEMLKSDMSLGLIIEGLIEDAESIDLAQRRAESVRKMFISKGASPAQISVAQEHGKDNRKDSAVIFRIIKK